MGFLRLYDHWDKESPNEALWILLPVERGVFSCELSVNAKFGMKESAPRVTCTVPDSCDPWRYFRQFQSKSIRLHPPHLHIRHLSADPNTGHFSVVVRTTLMYRLIRICKRGPSSPMCYLPTSHQTWNWRITYFQIDCPSSMLTAHCQVGLPSYVINDQSSKNPMTYGALL